MMDDNPFERDTQMVKDKDALADLGNVRKIMLDSRDKRFDKIVEFIQTIFDNPDKQSFYPESLASELKYMKMYYNSINNESVPPEVDFQQYEDQKFRLIQLSINLRLKKGEPVPDKIIKQMCQLIKQNPNLKQQAMMKTVGCKTIKRMVDISRQQIDDLTPDLTRKAIKYQIAADWKFIIGMEKQAIQLKTEAHRLWEKLDKITRGMETKQQLDQLTTICKGKKVDTPYVNKLKTIRNIVCDIQKIPPISEKEKLVRQRRKIAIKNMIPKMLEQMELMVKQNPKDNKNLSASALKKRGIIQQRKQIGEQFIKEISKNNYIYCQLIPQNKFQTERVYSLQKSLGVFVRVYKKKFRDFWDRISLGEGKDQDIKQSQYFQQSKSASKMKKLASNH